MIATAGGRLLDPELHQVGWRLWTVAVRPWVTDPKSW